MHHSSQDWTTRFSSESRHDVASLASQDMYALEGNANGLDL